MNTTIQKPNSHQKADRASVAIGGVLDDLQDGSGRGINDPIDISADKKQDDQEDSSCEGADENAAEHDLGAFYRRLGDFWQALKSCLRILGRDG